MMFIVTIHTLRHGGVLSEIEPGTIDYILIYSIFTVVNVGVDIFALISGFVGFRTEMKRVKWRTFFQLWLVVLFYSLIFMLCTTIYDKTFSLNAIFTALTPLTSQTYWYFTSYFFVFLLSPYINYIINTNTKRQCFLMLAFGLCALYLSHRIDGWFSICLLLYLYTVGATIRKYDFCKTIPSIIAGGIILLCSMFITTWATFFSTLSKELSEIWLRYDSPFIIIISVCWVLLFARMNCFTLKGEKVIRIIAPSVFSIYLINDNPFVRENVVARMIPSVTINDPIVLSIAIILSTILFFSFGLLIDLFRRFIFRTLNTKNGL